MVHTCEELQHGIVLAELGGYTDGSFCATHGKGSALVMMGTYVIEDVVTLPYPQSFIFPPDTKYYLPYLHEQIPKARTSGADVGVSVISLHCADSLDFLRAAEDAGAAYVSLCAHSSLERFVSQGLGIELCRHKNRKLLRAWATSLVGTVTRPLIFKIGILSVPETLDAVKLLSDTGIPMIHVDVGTTAANSPELDLLSQLGEQCHFLIASGGIQTIEDVHRVLGVGVDAVAIGTAAMKNPELCGKLQQALNDEREHVPLCKQKNRGIAHTGR
jgi:tRNA-dihydrouridine synthase